DGVPVPGGDQDVGVDQRQRYVALCLRDAPLVVVAAGVERGGRGIEELTIVLGTQRCRGRGHPQFHGSMSWKTWLVVWATVLPALSSPWTGALPPVSSPWTVAVPAVSSPWTVAL